MEIKKWKRFNEELNIKDLEKAFPYEKKTTFKMYNPEFNITKIVRYVGIFKKENTALYYKFIDMSDAKGNTINLYLRFLKEYEFTPL